MGGRWKPKLASLAVVAIVVLTGCATLRHWQAGSANQLLTAAGFKVQVADTAAQQQHLEAMPAYRLLSRTKDDGVWAAEDAWN